MIDTGMMVSPEVLSVRNIIIELLAVSFFVFMLCSSCIAFSPTGVAALSSPSMFADTFMNMEPSAGWFLGISGNSLVSTGLRNLASLFTSPLSSPIFRIPIHKVRVPVSPSVISKAVVDILNVESIISGRVSMSPKKISFTNPMMTPMAKRAIQI